MEKGEGGRKGGAWKRERKEGRGSEGINLPHGRLHANLDSTAEK